MSQKLVLTPHFDLVQNSYGANEHQTSPSTVPQNTQDGRKSGFSAHSILQFVHTRQRPYLNKPERQANG